MRLNIKFIKRFVVNIWVLGVLVDGDIQKVVVVGN